MQIRFRQREKFTKCAWMLHDAQNFSCGAMTFEATRAPFASPAGEVDFADNALSYKALIICHNDFADEFMSRGSREVVVAAKKFQIGIADASAQEPDRCIAFRPPWLADASYGSASFLKVNRNHQGLAYHLRFNKVMERIS